MSEMIERVAKALKNFTIEPPEGPVLWDEIAIVAIEAMREPTEKMTSNAAIKYDELTGVCIGIYQEMIDAALK